MSRAHGFVPLRDRAADWAMRMAMVREAEQFLYLSTFYFEYDDYGQELLEALQDAQDRGVRVALLIDGFGQRLGGTLMGPDQRVALERALVRLASSGGQVAHYRPPRWIQQRVGGGQHVKVQVSEAGRLILSSGNLTRTSFTKWKEYAVALEGAVVPEILASWKAIGGRLEEGDLRHLQVLADAHPGDMDMEYGFCNPNLHQGMLGPWRWRGSNVLTDRMIEMVDAAREELLISSFYFKPAPPLAEAILRAARRGVRIVVHHSHRDALPATDLAWVAAAVGYPAFLDAGVRVVEHPTGEHSKIIVVDRRWAAFGSYNFEDPAHDRLAEAMLSSRDHRTVRAALEVFAELEAAPDKVEVTAETVSAWPAGLKARVALWGRFKWWL
ncbi:MAG: phosphatidylserine/phosphatidylglycerophosphate/cardiolipin synthase family protein [Candidatus Sericytochromatia bacterium]|nr:phosphatidylserine/phosphatidylglycerophosphate/cardiolipin synthase family protein [Candidatus Sericytochromatia bacterium]